MIARVRTLVSVAAVALVLVTTAAEAASPAEIQAALQTAYDKYRGLREGANADYIPALAKVDPNVYGIALVTVDGKAYTAGDLNTEVSIQSISKVFTMAKVIEDLGPAAIADNMGVDATGQVFNSIVAVEQYRGKEMNPLVNAGAITATSMVSGSGYDEIWGKINAIHNDFAGQKGHCQLVAKIPCLHKVRKFRWEQFTLVQALQNLPCLVTGIVLFL